MFAEYLHDREQYWLDHFRAYDPKKGFNLGKVARAPWLGRSHSEETRQKIREHTKANLTSEQIAVFQNASIEWHGSDAGKRWHSQHSKEAWQQRQFVEKACEQCGAVYETRHMGVSKFCSSRCKNRARQAKRLDHESRTCAVCGQSFECNKHFSTQCCSESCAAKKRWQDKGDIYRSDAATKPRHDALKQFWAARQPVQKACVQCGVLYETTCLHSRAKFCSSRCKQAYYYQHKGKS